MKSSGIAKEYCPDIATEYCPDIAFFRAVGIENPSVLKPSSSRDLSTPQCQLSGKISPHHRWMHSGEIQMDLQSPAK